MACCFYLFTCLLLFVLNINLFFLFIYRFPMHGVYLLFLLTCLLVRLCPPPFLNNLKSQHCQQTGAACVYADPIQVRRRSCRMCTALQPLGYNAFPCVTCCTLGVCLRTAFPACPSPLPVCSLSVQRTAIRFVVVSV